MDWGDGTAGGARDDTAEELAFATGTALAELSQRLVQPEVPGHLLSARLALRAAESAAMLIGRPERGPDLRDEVHLLRPGDQPGPAGAIFQMWLRAISRRVSPELIVSATPGPLTDHVPRWFRDASGTPVARAAQILEAALAEAPRQEPVALMLADATLSQSLKWPRAVPLLGIALKRADLRLSGTALRMACYQAIRRQVPRTLGLATDLTRRTERLHAIAPKLRSKASDAALGVFLSSDALSPTIALSQIMTDRSARRLCDRLLELGVVQEFTGRPTFRLYGI